MLNELVSEPAPRPSSTQGRPNVKAEAIARILSEITGGRISTLFPKQCSRQPKNMGFAYRVSLLSLLPVGDPWALHYRTALVKITIP